MDEKRYVLARSHVRFRGWLRAHNLSPTEYRYVDRTAQLGGLRKPIIITLRECYEHENFEEIYEVARSREAIFISDPFECPPPVPERDDG